MMKVVHSGPKDHFKVKMSMEFWGDVSGIVSGLHMASKERSGGGESQLSTIANQAMLRPPVDGYMVWSRHEAHAVINLLMNYAKLVESAITQKERIIPHSDREHFLESYREVGMMVIPIFEQLSQQGFEPLTEIPV